MIRHHKKNTHTMTSVLALGEVLVAKAGKASHKWQLQTTARLILGGKKKKTHTRRPRNQTFLSRF